MVSTKRQLSAGSAIHMSSATVLRRTSMDNEVRRRNKRKGILFRGQGQTQDQNQGQSQGQGVDPRSSSPPGTPVSESHTRMCCFCCLTVKSGNPQQERSKDARVTNVQEKEEPPTLEELKTWGESFDKLMKDLGGRRLFREFLRSEYSEENMLFWLACEDLKSENNPDVVEEKARLIYEDYISILSPKEVSLDSRVREVINRNMVEPTPHTFDEAQLQIFTLMHRDSYPRFLNSQIYKRQLQQHQYT
ncbi:regulator of G-protein signaling rgs-2-like [Babylonia areolata]|uniref:regulator of G-protein signaling rgs-2-like n=1 Tax=Babylonia areolata TaxID=304850 RepID=UPI003FD3AEAD